MKNKLIALVPVRKGSQRVINKNNRPFGDSSLLDLKISILKNIDEISEIIVNSDCDEMLAKAKEMGVSTFKRESYFASSTVNNSEFFENVAKTTNNDYIMYAPVTCPFIKVTTFKRAIKKFFEKDEYDSLVTTFPVKHHMWLDGEPINYNPENSPNSQDLPNIFGLSYGISIITRDLMIKRRNVIGYKPYFLELGEKEAIDIDTEMEFEFANFIFKNKKF
jgi:CMP-N-acetylneuraminic acid synthetase